MHSARIVSGILLLAVGMAASAGNDVVYRWVDANGVTNYAARPPTTGTYETIRTNRARLSNEATAEQSADAEASAETAQCTTARENLRLLSGDAPVAQRDEQGNQQLLTDTQRASQLELAQAAVRAYCSEG